MANSWMRQITGPAAQESSYEALHSLVSNHDPGGTAAAKEQRLCEPELQQTVSEARVRELEKQCSELEESQRRLTTAFYEHAPVGYVTFDCSGYVVEANATSLILLEHDIQRLQQSPFRFFVHREDLGIFTSHLNRCKKSDGSKVVSELRLQSKNGATVPVQFISVPVNNAGQQLCRTVLVDLSERRRNEEALAETKEFSERIVETVREPLVVLDTELRIISVNRAFSAFFKKTAALVKDRPIEVILHLWWSGNRLRQVLERVLIKREPLENFELEVEPPGLGKRILLLNARRLYQRPNLPGHLLIAFEDITERKAAEEQLRQINHELELRVANRTEDLHRSYQQMESFCYSIAHDLRAPLRTMVSFSELLEEIYGRQIGKDGKDYMERIRQSGMRMDRMIVDLLSYGKLNTVRLPLEQINIDEIFHEVLSRHAKDIQEKKAVVKKPKPLPAACGHRVVLEVAFTNLLSNALKFVAPDVRPKVTVWHEDIDQSVRIHVQDNGIGIAPGNLDKIFGVFQRLHTSNSCYSGTGIGLALVSKGIERIGGQVGVESQPGTGSRFWIQLRKENPSAPERAG
jgi:PAS domain S-box-containing protein